MKKQTKIIIGISIIIVLALLLSNLKKEKQTENDTFLPGEKHDITELFQAKESTIVDLKDGSVFSLNADIVVKEINGKQYKMYGYNGQIPGVALRAKKGSTITINFRNNIDQNTTIHWHGLRHNIKDDGVPGVSQEPIKPGESYQYNLYFPDEGIYWYHPHVREDIQQDSGLAGNMIVESLQTDYYSPVNKEELLVLDDIFIQDNNIIPFGKEHAKFAIMGRFGNVMLVNGETEYALEVDQGSVLRFYITTVANVRPFNINFGNAKMKLIAGDMSKYEQETFVESVLIAPAERYILEVYFENPGEYPIQHLTPEKTYTLGTVKVKETKKEKDFSTEFNTLRENKKVREDVAMFKAYFDNPVDYQIDLTIDMPSMNMDMMHEAEHPQDGIEWEDTMPLMNEMFDSSTLTWILKDHTSEQKNMDFKMHAKIGEKIKIRLFNDPKSMHPMQHPIHLHGQRFLVLSVDGVPTENFVWKDTVLVPVGKTVDILVDVTNPGEWMLHCHIAEHLESGMMTSLVVE
ncbi:copper oxidase [Candidatus Woesearchaeota archaeon CG10_big_fil_rev_8_21_14_0_10_37_12]|nr:MAG: copper oxidase [Candidatus Woesearchaeota archaeon CG10_big_fil_rev_8_21_14_0_10_37_12]